jgi:hypothetical protein
VKRHGIPVTFEWPRFDDPIPLDADRSWTATFDSYDQRNDDIYYVVTITGRDGSRTRLVATTWPSWVGDDWTVPEFLPGLRRALHDVAARGESNTTYRPSWLPP